MSEFFPEFDSEDEENSAALDAVFKSGEVKLHPEVQEALDAGDRGDFSHPIIQGIRGECLILEATNDIPEDLAWLWDKVVPPLDS